MIAERLHHARAALDVGLLVVLAKREGKVAVVPVIPVRLDVRLAADHDALAVAEVVPLRHVRVVACAHGVDVKRLHQCDVPLHPLQRDGVARLRLHLVAVRALDEQALAVQVEHRVADLDLSEAERDRPVVRSAEDPPAPPVLDRRHVDVGVFARPELHVRDVALLQHVPILVAHDEPTASKIVRQLRLDDKVMRRVLALGDEVDVAEDARQAPEVLVLEI